MLAKTIINSALNFIYPPKCVLCGDVLPVSPQAYFCRKCIDSSNAIGPHCCAKCGRGMANTSGEFCPECQKTEFAFDRCSALWPYEGKYARAVLDLKFNNKTEKGKILGILCAEDIMKKQMDTDIDIVIPVPMNKSKMNKRGYNQAEIISRSIGTIINVPVDTASLKRIKKTVPQMDLNLEQRLVNMHGSMKVVAPENVAGKNILIIDDIFTTGSTLNECAAELKKSGAKAVNCYCVCISH